MKLPISLLRLAEAVVEGMDLSAICLPYLEDLHHQTEETTFFAPCDAVLTVVSGA